MKKLFLIFLATALLISSAASADLPDLSSLSFDELIALREQINLAIWQSQDWQEVTVPAGVWQVGVDIPAGYWTIKVKESMNNSTLRYFDRIDAAGLGPDYNGYLFLQAIVSEDALDYGSGLPASVSIDMKDGWYFSNSGSVVFSVYAGKPDLGFR